MATQFSLVQPLGGNTHLMLCCCFLFSCLSVMAVQLVLLKRMLQDQRMALAGPPISLHVFACPAALIAIAQSNILYMYDQLPRNAYLTGRQLVASTDKDSVSGSYQNIDEDEVGRVKAADRSMGGIPSSSLAQLVSDSLVAQSVSTKSIRLSVFLAACFSTGSIPTSSLRRSSGAAVESDVALELVAYR